MIRANARTAPIARSMAERVRASLLTRPRSPRPMAVPIMTADAADMAWTTTLRYE